MSGKITYRQQLTRCGKQRCRKCREGAGHGPYWYAYWTENGHTMSKYIGVHLPAGIEEKQQPVSKAGTLIADKYREPVTRSTNQHTSPALRIYLLGQFRVERRNGGEWLVVSNQTWHRRRARALLGCLLSSPGRRLGREQAMEALWPELDIETAANRLNGAVHELRQILEPEIARPAASTMLRLERDVLILADATKIWVDAEAFETLLNEANATAEPERAEQILEEAAAFYDGDYLFEELYSEWAAPRRESLRRSWTGLLLNLADLRAARGALVSAIEPLDRLLATEPAHETAVRRLMILLTQLDRRGEALQAYHRLTATLRRVYDSDPLPETRELYEALRQGHIRSPGDLRVISHPVETPQATLAESVATFPRDHADAAFAGSLQQAHGVAHYPLPTQDAHEGHPNSSTRPPGARHSGRHNQSPLVGRERDLDRMRQVLLAIEGGLKEEITVLETRGPHILLLMGEMGIGKTRLAEELSQEASTRGWSVAWSRAYEQEGTIPYRLWTEILRTLLQNVPAAFLISRLKLQPSFAISPGGSTSGHTQEEMLNSKLERLSALLPELRDMLPQLRLSPPFPPEQERLHLWEATMGILSALSDSTPLLLVLDDLHWADDSSLELLAYLARHLQDQRILIACTCRDMKLTPTHSLRNLINDLRREQSLTSLPVQPLTQSQIGSLVAYLPAQIVQSIQAQAAGNPFFAEELARYSGSELTAGKVETSLNSLYAGGTPGKHGVYPHIAEARSSLPETIAVVLDRRLSKLTNECRALLGKAAVLGGSFEFNHLLAMTGDQGRDEDAILDLLEEALRAGLLTEEDVATHITYHFWHPLIVSHLYERLSAARRAQLHRRAANALLQTCQGHEGEVAAAVTHHLSKGSSDPMQIARYAEIAGNQAYTLSAFSEAQRYYRQVIPIIADGQAASGTSDALHLAGLLERVGECSMVQGDYEEARRLYERVLELRKSEASLQQAQQQEAQRHALIWREIGRTWSETGEFAHAHECYKRGKQVMSDAGVTSGAAWACLHLHQGIMCWREGNYEEARRLANEALAMHEYAMQNQGNRTSADFEPQTTGLQTRTERALIGDPLEIGHNHEILGVIAATVGQLTESLQHLNTALAIYEQHDLVSAMATVCGNLGAAYTMKGEIALPAPTIVVLLNWRSAWGIFPIWPSLPAIWAT